MARRARFGKDVPLLTGSTIFFSTSRREKKRKRNTKKTKAGERGLTTNNNLTDCTAQFGTHRQSNKPQRPTHRRDFSDWMTLSPVSRVKEKSAIFYERKQTLGQEEMAEM